MFTIKLNNRKKKMASEQSGALFVPTTLSRYLELIRKLYGYKTDTYWRCLVASYHYCNDLYHNGKGDSPLDDTDFDALQLFLLSNKKIKKIIGAAFGKSKDIVLPHPMPSLEFLRTTDEIKTWAVKKGISMLLLTPKYDGISLYLQYRKGRFVFAATRGRDGLMGKDVTRHAMEARCIPKRLINPKEPHLPNNIDCELRCEIFLPESVFQKQFSHKNGGTLKTSRNAVAGAFNRNKPNKELLSAMDCRIFEVFSGPLRSSVIKDSELSQMRAYGLPMTEYKLQNVNNVLNLDAVLSDWSKSLDVLMDGVVCETAVYFKRTQIGNETNSINPGWARAFKPLKEAIETKVLSIGYSITKDNYVKPTINVRPTEIGGVTVSNVNGFNAGNLRDRGIDCGAVITISRRGDTIPHLESVVKSVKWNQPTLLGPLHWNETNVDLIATESGDEHKIQQLIQFFDAMGVEYFNEGNVRKFYKHGLTTVPMILQANATELEAKVPGIKTKSSNRIRYQFDKLRNFGVTLPKLMYASGCFGRGFGEDKLQKLYDHYGDQMFDGTWSKFTINGIAAHVAAVKGFSHASGVQFSRGLTQFKQFQKTVDGLIKIKQIDKNGALHDQTIVFTEFRDEELKELIKTNGGAYSDSLVKTTTILLRRSEKVESKKTAQADKMNIKIMTIDQFKNRYKL